MSEVDRALVALVEKEKDKGNTLFKAGKLEQAVQAYSAGVERCGAEPHDEVLGTLRRTVLSNRAQCYLGLKKWAECKLDCDEVLGSDPCNVKALYRRAQALAELGNPVACVRDCDEALRHSPGQTAILSLKAKFGCR